MFPNLWHQSYMQLFAISYIYKINKLKRKTKNIIFNAIVLRQQRTVTWTTSTSREPGGGQAERLANRNRCDSEKGPARHFHIYFFVFPRHVQKQRGQRSPPHLNECFIIHLLTHCPPVTPTPTSNSVLFVFEVASKSALRGTHQTSSAADLSCLIESRTFRRFRCDDRRCP